MDDKKLNFWTEANYLKRDEDNSDATSLSVAAFGNTSHDVNHDAGYIPFVEVFAELDNDGILWAGDKIDKYTETSLSGYSRPSPYLRYWTTTNTLTIRVQKDTSGSATVPIRWLVYKDYRNA